MSYTHEARQYINKLIRLRNSFTYTGKGHKPELRVLNISQSLQAELDAYAYTDRTMAGFFVRNALRIHELIPIHNGQPNRLTDEYQTLLAKARMLCREFQLQNKI